MLNEILINSKLNIYEYENTIYGRHFDYISCNGRGVRYKADGSFIGLLEP